jgi:hypothetical protein
LLHTSFEGHSLYFGPLLGSDLTNEMSFVVTLGLEELILLHSKHPISLKKSFNDLKSSLLQPT